MRSDRHQAFRFAAQTNRPGDSVQTCRIMHPPFLRRVKDGSREIINQAPRLDEMISFPKLIIGPELGGEGQMSSAFISYSIKDERLAKGLYKAASMAGIETFMAGISIEPGSNWTEEIFDKLEKADWVFFIASKN